jgi:hypothetical protein
MESGLTAGGPAASMMSLMRKEITAFTALLGLLLI